MSDGLYVSEELRKQATKNLPKLIKANDSTKLARRVDEVALEKCMVSQYAQYQNNLERSFKGEHDDIEKVRGQYGEGYRPAEVPLEIPLEKIYFDAYGCGFDGSPYPSRLGAPIYCRRCGLKYVGSPKLMPEHCPICGKETVLGELIKDKFWKRV